MGYQADFGTILTTVEKRFGKKMTGDRLPTRLLSVEPGKGGKSKGFCRKVRTTLPEVTTKILEEI